MQFLRNDVFSAPTSFFALASLIQAVRLACLAAASTVGGAADDAGVGAVEDGDPGAPRIAQEPLLRGGKPGWRR
jgi:hypothetical protein